MVVGLWHASTDDSTSLITQTTFTTPHQSPPPPIHPSVHDSCNPMTTTTSTTATDTCLHNIHDHRLITIINTMTSITTPATTIINITITIRRHGHFDLWHRSMTIATTINTTICHHELPSGPTHTTTKPCGHHPGFPSQVLLDAGADPNIKDNYGKKKASNSNKTNNPKPQKAFFVVL